MVQSKSLEDTLVTAATHLKPGGVLVMCPDWFRETFPDEFVSHKTRRRGDTSLTYIEYVHDPDPADTTVEVVMFMLIREHGQLRVEQDRHTIGLFPKRTWLELTAEAGFDVETEAFVKADYGEQLVLLVGVLRV